MCFKVSFKVIFILSLASLTSLWSFATSYASYDYEGKWMSVTFTREGINTNPSEEFQQSIQAPVYRKFWDLRWVRVNVPSHQCRASSEGGNGNGDWKGYWTAYSDQQKVQSLADAILGIGKKGAEQIVRDGYLKYKPQTWNEFAEEIRRADNQPDSLGYSRDVLGIYAERNKVNLGYAAKPAQINGNGNWEGFWDYGYSYRPYRLVKAVRGLSLEDANQIVRGGYMETLPGSWREFVNRIQQADRQLHLGFSSKVLYEHGKENMINLGYFDNSACEWSYLYNTEVLEQQLINEFDHYEEKLFQVEVKNSFLMKGEKEKIQIQFDGYHDRIEISGDYSKYNKQRYEVDSHTVKYVLSGERKKTTPLNVIELNLVNENGYVAAMITDLGFRSELADTLGDLVVTVTVYQEKFLFDGELGKAEFKLNPDGTTQKFNTDIKPPSGKKIYMKYVIKRINSAYFTQQKSDTAKSESIRF